MSVYDIIEIFIYTLALIKFTICLNKIRNIILI